MFDTTQWGAVHYISSVVLPFCTNLFFILFIFIIPDTDILPTESINSIPVTCGFFFFIEGMIEFIFYYISENGAEELFGDRNNSILVILVTFTYPVYFLFKLPFVIFRLFEKFGSPAQLWERAFSDTCSSLYNLSLQNSETCILFVFRIIYIGIPFFLFALIYIVVMICLSPLWYFIFSPFGLNMFGISSCITILSSEEDTVTVEERTSKVYYPNQFIMLFMTLSGIIFTICYLALVGAHWCAIILLVFCIITFIFNIIYVIAVTPQKYAEGCCAGNCCDSSA